MIQEYLYAKYYMHSVNAKFIKMACYVISRTE